MSNDHPTQVSKRQIWEKAKQLDDENLPGIKDMITLLGGTFGLSRIDLKDCTGHHYWEDPQATQERETKQRSIRRSKRRRRFDE